MTTTYFTRAIPGMVQPCPVLPPLEGSKLCNDIWIFSVSQTEFVPEKDTILLGLPSSSSRLDVFLGFHQCLTHAHLTTLLSSFSSSSIRPSLAWGMPYRLCIHLSLTSNTLGSVGTTFGAVQGPADLRFSPVHNQDKGGLHTECLTTARPRGVPVIGFPWRWT